MYRTHTCGELTLADKNKQVTLAGWVQTIRHMGKMIFLDLRDRYGITQVVFAADNDAALCSEAEKIGREYVIQIVGEVAERSNKNLALPTGEIEIVVSTLNVLNTSQLPPFTIETDTDGGEELRMKYRYLDLRRSNVFQHIVLRHQIAVETRNFLNSKGFLDIETPFLIKSTPEGARDFIVPSRINTGQFYALPQSPQTFKQLLMVSGFDKYYQIVRCFRDEDLRADRQPEFTQIDCEMSFVRQEDIFDVFEHLIKHLFWKIANIDLPPFRHMTYKEAVTQYGTDKPDLRFGMPVTRLNDVAKGKGFNIFDKAELVAAIAIPSAAKFSRKQLDSLTEWVKQPQIGMKGMIYVKLNEDGTIKSSVDKFYTQNDLQQWADKCNAKKDDLLLVLSGDETITQKALGTLRLKMGEEQGLIKNRAVECLWVTEFPLLEWDEEKQRYMAMHHPFTSPMTEDIGKLAASPKDVRANAYDMVINGVEVGGGSIRIHSRELQQQMFDLLGFTPEEAKAQFGFLMDALEYGAPPHGGIAFGFDRLCAMFAQTNSIRDVIAFPKNNNGRDIMLDAPAPIDPDQLAELGLANQRKEKEK